MMSAAMKPAAMKATSMKAAAMKVVAMKAAMKAAMKPAMKAAMKAAMKKRAMKVPTKKVAKGKGAKTRVFKGKMDETVGGLTKASLTTSKSGKVVSKARSARSKKAWASSTLKKWADAAKQARKELGITGFCPVGGSTPKGKALYAKVKAIVDKSK